jgi:NADPH:quinone reductase-like Zn-dependent oxidoreductase
MEAVVLDAYGTPDQLEVREVDEPVPGPGEVCVDIAAIGVNNMDLQAMRGILNTGDRAGYIDSDGPGFPGWIPGVECVGRISALGEGVVGWSVGDRVMPHIIRTCGHCRYCQVGAQSLCLNVELTGMPSGGVYAEKMVCLASQLVVLPDSIGDVEGAATQVQFSTPWQALVERAQVRPGERVLVNAVGSGVGSGAVQVAKLAGAGLVIGTASTQAKLDRAVALGMDVGIIYTERDLVEEVMRATEGEGVDVAFEHIGGPVFWKSIEALAKTGRLVTVGAHAEQYDEQATPFSVTKFFRSFKDVRGCSVYPRRTTERVVELVADGRLKPIVHQVFPLSRVQEAMAELGDRHVMGKVILQPTRLYQGG